MQFYKKNGLIRKYEPTVSDVHVNQPLTNISIAFMQDASGFVADRVFQNIPVTKQSDRYYTYDRAYFFRNQMARRAPGTESAGVGYKVDNTPSYYADIWALHHDIPDAVRANADSVLSPDMDATNLLSQQALINREIQFTNNWFKPGVWTYDLTGVTSSGAYSSSQFIQWSTANSTPIEDIRHFITAVASTTGFRPNILTLGRQVWDVLQDHAEIIDRVKYGQTGNSQTTPAKVTREAVAALLELDEINVMDAIYETAAEGLTATYSFIGGKNALLTYRPRAPGLMVPAAGYTFSWTGYLSAGPQGQRMSKFRMEQLKSDRAEIEVAYAQKLISADLGAFFGSAVV